MGCPVRYYRSYWLLLMNRVKEEIHMKEYIKNNWNFLLFVFISGWIGGYCIGLYIPEMYSQEMLQQLQG